MGRTINLIFVAVGTSNIPFDRLIKYINQLSDDLRRYIFLQSGNSNLIPNVNYERYISNDKFLDYIKKADLVISHGGYGILMECIRFQKKVIVIPRMYEKEAIHSQFELAKYLSDQEPFIRLFLPGMNLEEMIWSMLALEGSYKNEYKSKIPKIVLDYLLNL